MQNLPSKANGSALSSPERAAHRDWIGGRAITLLSHYWRDDDPVELTAALGKDWADVLEGLPQDAIQKACIQYQRDEPRRRPTPGAIYQIARALMPRPAVVPSGRPQTREEQDEYMAQARQVNEERKAQAERIMAEVAERRKADERDA